MRWDSDKGETREATELYLDSKHAACGVARLVRTTHPHAARRNFCSSSQLQGVGLSGSCLDYTAHRLPDHRLPAHRLPAHRREGTSLSGQMDGPQHAQSVSR